MQLSSANIVRLNAELFPINSFEQEKYNEYGIVPRTVEATSVEQLIDVDAVVMVSTAMPAEVLQAMKRCCVICRMGAGVDKIDIAAATKQGIVIANVPDFCYEEQADHAFALLLSVARKLNEMRTCMLQTKYREGREICRPLRRLPGRTLGLVGFGGSAKAMARRAAGFQMRVLATRGDMSKQDPDAEQLGVEMVGLDQLLRESDYVSLHLPLSSATRHMFDKARLLSMKPGAILINTARGAIVDEDALAEVLGSGHLMGAGLDTFYVVNLHTPDPEPADHPLFQMENVVFTPHTAAFSVDSSREVGYGTVESLVAVLTNRWPRRDRIVNPDVQPRIALS